MRKPPLHTALRAALLAVVAAVALVASCTEGRAPTAPGGTLTPMPIRLALNATVAAAGRAIKAVASYRKAAAPTVPIPFDSATVTLNGTETQVSVRLDLAPCLADDAREGAAASVGGAAAQQCVLHLTLILLDASNEMLDQAEITPLPAEAGQQLTTSAVSLGIQVGKVTISQRNPTINAIGYSVDLTTSVLDVRGQPIAQPSLAYRSLAPAIVEVDSSTGRATARATGTARLVAASRDKSDTTTVTVRQVAKTVTLSGPTKPVVVGDTTLVVGVSVRDSADVAIPATDAVVQFSSSDTTVATVNAVTGRLYAVGAGSSSVQAASGPARASLDVTVALVPVASVAVTPAAPSVNVGQIVQLEAVTKDSAGNVLAGRAVSWSSSDSTIASIGATGSAVGQKAGQATITATSEGKTGTATVAVTQPVQGVRLQVTSPVAASRFYVVVDSGGLTAPLAFAYPGSFARIATLTVPLPAGTGYRVRLLVTDSLAIAPATFPFVTAGIRLSDVTVTAGAPTEVPAVTKAITGTSTRPASAIVGQPVIGSASITDPSEFFVGSGLCPYALVKTTPFTSATGTPFVQMCSTISMTATTATASGQIAVPTETGTLYSMTRFQRESFTIAGVTIQPIFDTPSLQLGQALQTTQVSAAAAPPPPNGTRLWVGGASSAPSDWFTAANWSPAGTPAASDTVVVNAGGSQPVMNGADTVAALIVGAGATLEVRDYLQILTSVTTEGRIMGSGPLRVSGGVSKLAGAISYIGLYENAKAVLTGPATIGTLSLAQASELVMSGHHAVVTTLGTAGQATVSLTDPADTLDVTGQASFGSASTSGRLSAGVLRIGGYFYSGSSAGGSAGNFVSTGTRVIANGGTQQVWYVGGSTFHDLVLSNTGVANGGYGVYLAYDGTTMTVAGSLTQTSGRTYITGSTTVAGQTRLEGGTLTVNAPLTVHGSITTAAGTTIDGGSRLTLRDASGTGGIDGIMTVQTLALATPARTNVALKAGLDYNGLTVGGGAQATASSNITLTGALTLDDSASLTLGGHHVMAGSLMTGGQATLTLANAADTLDVTGQANFASSASENGKLTAGVLRIGGYFYAGASGGGSTGNFVATGTRVVANGTNQQVWYVGGSTFQDLVLANRSTSSGYGVYLAYDGSTLTVAGSLTQTSGRTYITGPTTVAGQTRLEGGTLSVNAPVTVGSPLTTAAGTTIDGSSTLTLRDASGTNGIQGIITVGTLALAAPARTNLTLKAGLDYNGLTIGAGVQATASSNVTFAGALALQDSASLTVGGHHLSAGSLTTGGKATLTLANAADTLDVAGQANFASSASETGRLTAGVLRIGGYFYSGSSAGGSAGNFVATGTRIIANGASQQVWYVGGSTFQDLVLANTSTSGYGVYLAYDGASLTVTGALTQTGGQTYIAGPTKASSVHLQGGILSLSAPVTVSGPLTTASGTRLDGGGTLTLRDASGTNGIDGTLAVSTLALGGRANITLTRAITLSGALVVQDSANLVLGGHRVAAGSFMSSGQATVALTNPADTLDVVGQTTFGSATSENGLLSAGVLRIGGYLYTGAHAGGNAATFVSTGTRIIANGTTQQVWYVGGSTFRDLVLANTTTSPQSVGVYLAYDGGSLIVNGSLTLQLGYVASYGVVDVLNDLFLAPGTTLANNGTIKYGGTYTNQGATVTGSQPVHR